ncbi:MAG: low specificity L-threonine aldolase [candidate division Zixibacteria bacterium]|nr:low specificity L-threonine aldolase [candidate division Zixibacteria bacterium]
MNREYVDLRSDTVTRPSAAMRAEMARAEVGDDVYREDPTVNRLQEVVAELLAKEAGLFMPSGTMSNQVAVRAACRGGEAICEADAHTFHYEMAAAAARSGIQLVPVAGTRGVLTWADVEGAIRPVADYFPRTGLICLENTHNRAGGTIFPVDVMADVAVKARARGIPVHLDGARLWNASVATGTPLAAYAASADSVSVCFSKGLGAPVGSCLCGSREFVEEAIMVRRSFGGAMRQAGILAAAALYAVEHNVERLGDDHRRARTLAEGLADIPAFSVDVPETNIVMVDVTDDAFTAPALAGLLEKEGVSLHALGPRRLRAVTHLELDDADIERALNAFEGAVARLRSS